MQKLYNIAARRLWTIISANVFFARKMNKNSDYIKNLINFYWWHLRDPLVNCRDRELASLLQSMLYQLRVGEGRFFRSIGSQKIPVVESVGRKRRLIRVLLIHRWIFMFFPDVVGVIWVVRPSIRFALVAWKCAISLKTVKSIRYLQFN